MIYSPETENRAIERLADDLKIPRQSTPRAVEIRSAGDDFQATGADALVVKRVVGFEPTIADERLVVEIPAERLDRALRSLILAGHIPVLLRTPGSIGGAA